MKTTRFLTTGLAALGLLMLGAISAQADDVVADEPWQLIDTFDDGSGHSPHPSANSLIVDPTTLDLVWVAGITDGHGGTSLETSNLGLDVTAGTPVSVDYELRDGADPSGRSIRLSIFYSPDVDTWSIAPCGPAGLDRTECEAWVPVDGTELSGTLTFNAPLDGTIGTAGLIYDTSNGAGGGVPGTVRFTNLRIGDDVVLFTDRPEVCEWDSELLAEDEKCVDPESTEDTETKTDTDETDDPVAVPTAIPAGSELPSSGVNSGLIGLAVAGLVGLGVGGLWLRRRFDH